MAGAHGHGTCKDNQKGTLHLGRPGGGQGTEALHPKSESAKKMRQEKYGDRQVSLGFSHFSKYLDAT